MTNGLYHHYHLGESTFIVGDIWSVFEFLLTSMMNFLKANRIAPDGTPHSAASHQGLYCLAMSHKKEARFI